MADKFRDRLKRLHDAHRRGKDSDGGPTGVYSASEAVGDVAGIVERSDIAKGYGWERLGGVRCDDFDQPLWVATERVGHTAAHGDWTVGQCWQIKHGKIADLDQSVPPGINRRQMLFMDTETSGLGKGAMAFMIGLGFWEDDQFVVEHLLIDDEEQEPALLEAFARRMARFEVLVTFNGRRFDVPLLQRRFAHHELADPFPGKNHLDLLPMARRVFPDLASYRLSNLEKQILSFERVDDVPGKDIPPRWWKFQKNKNSELMKGVLEHNRHDVVSMEALVVTAIAGGTPEVKLVEGQDIRDFLRLGFKGFTGREFKKTGEPQPSTGDAQKAAEPRGVAKKLERTYRLRGKFARKDRKERHEESGVIPPLEEPQSPPGEAAMQRVEELRAATQGLVAQQMWREAFPLLAEMVALSPTDRWAVQNLAEYYRRDGREELAAALEKRM